MLEVKNLSKIYKKTCVVNQVSFKIEKGEVFALVGESGSGKSTLGKMILGLIEPTSGEIFFEGKKKIHLLPRRMQMIFQDPYSSLNPRMSVHSILSEPTDIHHLPNRVEELLDLVQLPQEAKKRYPHEFSGGQKQRIVIARALALNPDFLVCDEAVSSLDAKVQLEILHLFQKLQKELDLTILFISHDLRVVRYFSNRVAVLYRGEIAEIQDTGELFSEPAHSYTQTLIANAF